MVRFYRNKNIFWSWIEIKICFSVEVYKHRKKSIHIFSSQRICRSLLLQCMLMRGLCINIQIFWVSFLWAHSLVEKFCGELRKRLKQPFPPIRLAKTSSRGAFFSLLTSLILRKRRSHRMNYVCVCVCDERGGGDLICQCRSVKSLKGSSTNNERPGNHPK